MADFQSDGCTGVPDGEWGACCLLHDWFYWWQPDGITRQMADWAMTKCMVDLGHGDIAQLYSLGLTLLGWFFWLRGRRAQPGTEPHTLVRWIARVKEHFGQKH